MILRGICRVPKNNVTKIRNIDEIKLENPFICPFHLIYVLF